MMEDKVLNQEFGTQRMNFKKYDNAKYFIT